MKAKEYLLEILKNSNVFEESKAKLVAVEIVKNQKITSICENNNENELWSSKIEKNEYTR